jgi:hypothetical protein
MDSVPPLPDEYFLLAHHDYTGRPHINIDVLNTGLAGAVIAELLIEGHIDVLDEKLVLCGPGSHDDRTTDPMTDMVLAHIAAQTTPHPIRAWTEYLRDNVTPYAIVRERLLRAGLLQPVRGGLLKKSTRYVATDPLTAAKPRVRLRYTAERSDTPVDARTAMLASLAQVTGLTEVVADGANRSVKEGLLAIAAGLPANLRVVVSGLDAAVTVIALSVPGR